jgi:tyrosyl-tRNA synthetase
MLSHEQVRANAETYMAQFFEVVDRDRCEVRWQSEWFGSFDLAQVFNLTSRFTMQQMLAHDTFRKRYEEGRPLSMMELMYPLLQAYDSVAIQSDVEFGGTDQKFNILAGRELMASLNLVPQQVLLVPLLVGLDGRKMSKSFGNTIDVVAPPDDMYGKVMSISDDVLLTYFWNITDVPQGEIAALEQSLRTGTNPRDIKMRLAREIVAQFHNEAAARKAEETFIAVFQKGGRPDEMPLYTLDAPTAIVDVIVASGLAASKSEARRLIDGGGVRLDDEKVASYDTALEPQRDYVLQVGKRRFVRVVGG